MNKHISLDVLNIKDRTYLGALFHTSLLQKDITIDLTLGIPPELAPTKEYRESIIARLLDKNILVVHEISTLSGTSIHPDHQNLQYLVNIQDIESILPRLMYPKHISSEDKKGVLVLLQKIQLYEAIEYMYFTLHQFKLRQFQLEPRYTQLFLQILKVYSLGQLFNFIYTAIRNQAAQKQRDSSAYIPLANYIYKKIIDRFERAEAGGWKIVHFNRVWGWPQSELSKLVCNKLLDVGDSILYEVIDEYYDI